MTAAAPPRHVGRPAMGVRSMDYDPPEGDRYLYVQVWRASRRHNLSVGALSDARLRWLARVVTAELQRRQRR